MDFDCRDFDRRVLDTNLYFCICVFLIKFFCIFVFNSEDDNLLSGSRSQWGLPTGRDLLTGPPAGLEIFAINDRYGTELQRRDTSFNAPVIFCSFPQLCSLCSVRLWKYFVCERNSIRDGPNPMMFRGLELGSKGKVLSIEY